LRQPHWNIAVGGVCADTAAEAARLAGMLDNPYLTANVVGDPEQCRARLLQLAERYETREIIFLALIAAPGPRLRCYQLLAQALGLSSKPCGAAVSPDVTAA
jgi:alkanesulfonate monooxygenase SsuD/methylene tetrahydromethanopterin reductase-like flavin-dependent oxidoreductase (luciferase family)